VRLGLRAQLLVAITVVAVGAIASVGVIAILVARQAFVLDWLNRAATWAETAGHMVELAVDPTHPLDDAVNRGRLPAISAALGRATEASELALYDERGRALAPAAPRALATDATGVAAALAGAPPHAQGLDEATLVAYAPVRAGAAVGALRISFPVAENLDAVLARARLSVLLLGAADALLLVLVGAWILRGVVVRPVLALEGAARRVAAGDLEARVGVRGPGELGRLADAFDQMTASLAVGRESLIRSEKLAGIGRLAAGVAHEIGNPLAAILGYSEMLLAPTPLDPATQRDLLERVRGETERIHKIIRELLEYARPSDEGVERVDVGRVIAGALSLVRAQARGRHAAIATRVPDDLPAASGQAGRLTQVLVNLLLNAVDAAGDGRVTVDARRDGARVVIGVEDDGPGVAPEHRARVFEPFFTTKEVGAGTGLGLSVSLAIVESWGGGIRLCEPGADRGARFEVYLSVANATSET
jgi:signal transduction histidine kinase